MDKLKLWIKSDRKGDGSPFIAYDKDISDEWDDDAKMYIRLDDQRGNYFGTKCHICGIAIVNGWECWEDIGEISYSVCDEHTEIMN